MNNSAASLPPPGKNDTLEADAAATALAKAQREARRRGLASLVIRPPGDYDGSSTGLSIGQGVGNQ